MLTNPQDSLQAAGVKDAAHLTAVVQQVQLAASCNAFAAWCRGGSRILTWGDQIFGGDCSAVQERLQNVQRVQGIYDVFVAILADGSVATWGRPDCSAVQDQLRDVQEIQATEEAFAAILADGSVLAWGPSLYGGDCSKLQDELQYL